MIRQPENIDLQNSEFQKAWSLLRETNRSVFLTGKAGTGKSTFLTYICSHTEKKYVILAPTGVAAVNVGGVTLHSFFQIPFRPIPPDDVKYSVTNMLRSVKLSKRKRILLKELELIVIDEVSMVRPDIIDFIDRMLRSVTQKYKEPFGGKQLLLVGDVFQLEPVVTSDARPILSRYYSNCYFFDAVVFRSIPVISIELQKVYRQPDPRFVSLLDRFRNNSVSQRDIDLINSKVSVTDTTDSFAITVTSRRETADAINRIKMNENPNEPYTFVGKIDGDFPVGSLPTEMELMLKCDAQVMLIKNNKEKKWVNGTLAKVVNITDNSITIELENGVRCDLEKEIWENIRYEYDEKKKQVIEEVLGTFTQYPLRAAWAVTVHKSQGLTFNRVDINLEGGAFSPGQTYVALSRCTSLEGIRIKNPITKDDVIVSDSAIGFSRRFNDQVSVEKALNDAFADRQYKRAREAFSEGRMYEAVDMFYEGLCYRNDLLRPAVRRLLGRYLSKTHNCDGYILQNTESSIAALVNEAESRISVNDLSGAETVITRALQLAPDSIDVKIAQGRLQYRQGEPKSALVTLRSISRRKDHYGEEANYIKAMIFKDSGNYDRAVKALQKILEINQNCRKAKKLLADINDSVRD